MTSKLTFFVVCAAVVQSSLATESSTVSRVQNGLTLDLSVLESYEAIAVDYCKKAIQTIRCIELQGYSAKADFRDKSAAEDGECTINACNTKVLDRLIGTLDAILPAIATVNSESTSTLTAARATGIKTLTQFVEAVCSALAIASRKDDPGAPAEIKAMANKASSAVISLNAGIFAAIRNGRKLYPQSEIAIERLERKAAAEWEDAVRELFSGIQLASDRTHVEKKDIVSKIKTTLYRALSKIIATIKTKFETLYTLRTADWIIEHGIVPDSSVIKAIQEPIFSQYEKPVSENLLTCKKDEPEIVKCDSKAARQITKSECMKGLSAIFSTMQNLMTKVPHKKKTLSESYVRKIRAAQKETTVIVIETVKAIMDTIPIANPKAAESTQVAISKAEQAVKKLVDDIYNIIISMKKNDSPEALRENQAMNDGIISGASSVVVAIYRAINYGKIIPDKYRDKIKSTEEEAMSLVKKSFHGIFIELQIRMTEVSSGTKVEGKDSKSSDAQVKATSAIRSAVQAMFHAMEIVCKISGEDRVKIEENLIEIRSHCEIAISKAVKAINLIFRDIVVFTEALPSDKNENEDYSSIIEAGYSQTSAVYRIAYQALIRCTLTTKHSADQNAAASALQQMVDDIYMVIKSTLGSDHVKIVNELQAFEATTSCDYKKYLRDLYALIQQGRKCDAETKAKIERLQETAIHNCVKSTDRIFYGIRISLATMLFGNESEHAVSLSLLKAVHKEAAVELIKCVDIVYDLLDLVSSDCPTKQTKILKDSCPARIP